MFCAEDAHGHLAHGMNYADLVVSQWLAELSSNAARAGAPPAGPGGTDTVKNNLIPLPTNTLGENYLDAVRHYGKRYGSTTAQIDQAVSRAQGLVAQGHSVATAVETVRKTLARWSQMRPDDATFRARKGALARGLAFRGGAA